jgi:hypothetical protein
MTFNRRALSAFLLLGRAFQRYGYIVRAGVTGSYNCRPITGGSVPSSHSWGTSVDVNWDTNPYVKTKLITDVPRPLVEIIEAYRTRDGQQVWRWGGDWDGNPATGEANYDAMHWEIMCSPAALHWGDPVFRVPTLDTSRRSTWPLLLEGCRGPAVQQLQSMLNGDDPRLNDGIFGPKTRALLKDFQAQRRMTIDGVVGLATWTALLNKLPPGDVAPNKGQVVRVDL